ncbi:MAG: CaiB/BaiF CoA transferase family protein [Acidimicrobiales bacterium]
MTAATDNGPTTGGALAGLRVIEMGQLLAGPFCAQLLGDFGAEVIKLEQPGIGDPMREWGREKPHGHSLWWPVVARNKKSVTVNLRREAGQDVVRRLAAVSDIVVENFRPGTLERWNLGYDDLVKVNPGIILIRVTGFGQTGPYASRAGYGSIGEAMGGLRYIVGDPSSPPSRMGISIGDSLAGTLAALGGLAAVHARETTGRGQIVDSAIYEAVLAFTESLIPEYQVAGYIRERTGATLPNVAPSNVYPTADGQMILVAANQDTVFVRLAEAMGRPELATDERYATHTARGKTQVELDDMIAAWTGTLDSDELLQALEEHAVPAGHIYRAPEMLEDPHFAARGSIATVPSEEFGDLRMQNVAPQLSDTPGSIKWPGPPLGAHNDEILRGLLGLSDAEVEAVQSTANQ